MSAMLALATALLGGSALAQAQDDGGVRLDAPPLCDSEARPAPRQLLDRFINADCAACWRDEATPDAAANTLALDWVLPGSLGDEAPLAAVARRDALERLNSLRLPPPPQGAVDRSRVRPPRGAGAQPLRVAHGQALSGYVGASLTWQPPKGMARTGPLTAWLALVEELPRGTEDSPVARRLVRNLVVAPIDPHRRELAGADIWRVLNVPEGAQPARLEVAGWVTDARGRVVAAAASRCPSPSSGAAGAR